MDVSWFSLFESVVKLGLIENCMIITAHRGFLLAKELSDWFIGSWVGA